MLTAGMRGIEAESAQDIVDTSGNFAQTHDKNQPWNNGTRRLSSSPTMQVISVIRLSSVLSR